MSTSLGRDPVTGRVLKYSCGDCNRQFRFHGSYLKHRLSFPFKHTFWICCRKFEKDSKIHLCRAKRKRGDNGMETDIDFEDDKSDVETEDPIKIAADSNFSTVDDLNVKEVGINDDVKMEFKSEADEPYEDEEDIDRPHRKKRRKRKGADKPKSNGVGEFKCEECPKSFSKSSSLGCHLKVMHRRQDKFKCQTCEEVFETSDQYYKHLFLHGPEDKVVCRGCRRVFDSLKLYHLHAKQNPGVHCFLCRLCLRKFPSELLLEQHVCICTNGQPMECACGKRFTRYHDVVTHSRGTKPFHCCCCEHVSNTLTAFLRHMRRHSKQKFYECKKCSLSFAVIEFYNNHNKSVHGDELKPELEQGLEKTLLLHCASCSEVFQTEQELEEHHATHGSERVACPDCGKSLKRSRLEGHRSTHKRSASLCPECGRLFNTRFKLAQHILTAHHSVPVTCELCSKVLKTKKILNEHMKTHLKSEIGLRVPQAICPMCGLGLAQKGSLTRHILLMHERHKLVPCEKTYTCQECAQVLPSKAKYYSHRRMHKAMVERYPCSICGREFNKKQNLRRHMYLLHDERRIIEDPVHGCQICTRSFREKKNLRRHYKIVHKWHDPVI